MTAWALAAAVASAFWYALAAALQQREADQAPTDRAAGVVLVWHLCRQPRWVGGIVAMAAGAALHTLALSIGPLPLVQPVGVAGLLFALPLGARLHRHRQRVRDWYAAAAVAAGLALFLAVVRSPQHAPHLSNAGTIGLVVVATVGIVGCVASARRLAGTRRTLPLAAGAGIAFGSSSALVHAIGERVVSAGPIAVIGWPTVTLAVLAATGFVLCQHAYRSGNLGAALATMTVVDPLTAIALGAALLGEGLHADLPGVLAACAAAVLTIAGVLTLAGRPQCPSEPSATQPIPASPLRPIELINIVR